jgi:HlyD family secretion protein
MPNRVAQPDQRRSVSSATARDGIRANLLLGLAVTILLIGGVGAWATTTSLAGAVIAAGTVVVESNVKKVQHQSGGIVGEILVREGDTVAAGDVVMRLDETVARASLQILTQQLDRTIARRARLESERLGLAAMKIPATFEKRLSDLEVAALMEGERLLFESRAKALAGQKSQLETRAGQLRRQIEGLDAQRRSVDESARLVANDLESMGTLYSRKLVALERVSDLQLELSRLRGESGRLVAAIAEIEGKISETKLQIIQIGEDMRKDVNEDLRDMEGREVELAERKLVAQDQLARTTIRAPQAGIVQELAVHTVGGVIGASETMMLIVPATDGLVIDARISPVSIDDVVPGQPVAIRFSAFDANTTPICDGSVQRISADLLKDPQTQIPYFVARVKLDDRKTCLDETKRLLPGMPAEVHIQTGERNVWSYVMKPLTDQMARAFAE